MSLIDASEDSTPSTAPMETLVVFEDSALEMRSASMPLSALGGARRRASDDQRDDRRRQRRPSDAEKKRRHQKACPMLT